MQKIVQTDEMPAQTIHAGQLARSTTCGITMYKKIPATTERRVTIPKVLPTLNGLMLS